MDGKVDLLLSVIGFAVQSLGLKVWGSRLQETDVRESVFSSHRLGNGDVGSSIRATRRAMI